MKLAKIALVAIVAASVIPVISSPAEAKVRWYKRVYNRAYAPYSYGNGYGYPYGYPTPYQQKQAAANNFVNQVNQMIQSGQITVQQGNQMLVQGHM